MQTIIIEDYRGKNPFEEFPQLKTIWPKELYELAVAGVTEHLEMIDEYEIGNVYLVKENDQVVGITGFYPYDGLGPKETVDYQSVENIGLRWHGVIPERRGNGISATAFELMLEQANIKFENAGRIIEIVPDHPNAEGIKRHFEKLGFVKSAEPPTKYDWSEYKWSGYSYEIKPEKVPSIGL